jgi:hypothetical protein
MKNKTIFKLSLRAKPTNNEAHILLLIGMALSEMFKLILFPHSIHEMHVMLNLFM